MAAVVVIRHCESLFNADPQCQDRNCGLTPRGAAQAAQLVAHQDADLVICSPLRRCLDTLRLSSVGLEARRRGAVVVTPLCREVIADACDLLEGEDATPESAEALNSRVAEFRRLLCWWGTRCRKIVVVSHADFIWHLTSHAHAGQVFGQWLGNGECAELALEI
jgi:broad specificity phosphatase PhoE